MELINVESLSGHEQPMAVVLKRWLEQRDWVVQLQEVEPQKSTVGGKSRHNLYARRAGIPAARTEGPRFLFNSHIDTVCSLWVMKSGAAVLRKSGAAALRCCCCAVLLCAVIWYIWSTYGGVTATI
ncbi:unnamed protein product [Laminaria digitata]